MAIVLIEGFDHYSAAEIAEKFWSGSPSGMAPGRLPGSQAIDVIINNQISKILPSTYPTVVWGAAIHLSAATSPFMTLWGGGLKACTIGISGGYLQVTDSAGRTFTGTTIVPIGSWFFIELKASVGTSGTLELHLNGAVEIASATANLGTANFGEIEFDNHTLGGDTWVDDVYVLDTTGPAPRNDFLGDVAVRTLFPTADGTYTNWTASPTNPRYENVNETQIDGDASFIYDSTPGDKDTVTVAPLPVGTVYGAQLNLGARKGDAGTLRQIEPLIRQSAVDHIGPTFTLSAAYLFYSWLLNQDPTGTDWTGATINADEYGVELVA